jgi:hypothetical protein
MSYIDDRKKNFLMNENFIVVITEGLKNPQKLCEMKDRLLQEEISLADDDDDVIKKIDQSDDC